MIRIILSFFLLLSGCSLSQHKIAGTVQVFESLINIEDAIPKPDEFDLMIEEMTLEEKIGQMLLVRASEIDERRIEECHIGGLLFFGKDFNVSREDFIQRVLGLQEQSKIDMIMAVDEEGGVVNRISFNPEYRSVPFYSPQLLYQLGGYELIQSDTVEKCDLLKSLGLNVNMAPVADIAFSEYDYMYDRTFSLDPLETSSYVSKVVEVMKDEQVGSCLKHFPGYGGNVDTHEGVAVDTRELDEFRKKDWMSFKAGINEDADMVLMSHTIVEAIDSIPVCLSTKAHELLRNELGFDGVIITDDLEMSGITMRYTLEEAAILAIEAGNDMLIVDHMESQYDAILQAVRDQRLSEESINASVKRILMMKERLNIINIVE